MFKRIAVIGCEDVTVVSPAIPAETVAEFRWLIDQEIVFDPRIVALSLEGSLDNETIRLLDDWEVFTELYKGKVEQIVNRWEEQSPEEFGMNTYKEKVKLIDTLQAVVSTDLLLRPLSTYYRNAKNRTLTRFSTVNTLN